MNDATVHSIRIANVWSNNEEFLGAMANAIWVGSYYAVRLLFPLIWMTKADVCKRALELYAPLHLTWSCYSPMFVGADLDGGKSISQYLQCGQCPTCIERIEAFKQNGVIDPVPYHVPVNWNSCVRKVWRY